MYDDPHKGPHKATALRACPPPCPPPTPVAARTLACARCVWMKSSAAVMLPPLKRSARVDSRIPCPISCSSASCSSDTWSACACKRVCMCSHGGACACARACGNACMHVCMHARVCVHACACTCACVRVHAGPGVFTHTTPLASSPAKLPSGYGSGSPAGTSICYRRGRGLSPPLPHHLCARPRCPPAPPASSTWVWACFDVFCR